MSKPNMLIPANLPGVQVPEGYMLVAQAKPAPNKTSNSAPKPAYGRNWNQNQRKRERQENFQARGAGEPARRSGPATPPGAADVEMFPVVAQPMGSITAESGLSPEAYTGPADGEVVIESVGTHPGYNTAEYAQARADKLAIRNQNNLSVEVLLNYVKKLMNYLYSFSKVLASADPGAKPDIIKTWRYANNGIAVITGGNILSVVCEILFYCKVYGNPVEGDEFLTPALDKISIHPSLIKGTWLKSWTEEEVMKMSPEVIVTKLDGVTKSSDAFFILKKFVNVLDNSGQLMARLPHGIFQPCLKFVGSNDEPRLVGDAYILASSKRYYDALNALVGHVQKPHVPLIGHNPINSLLKGTGLSLGRFASFAQAENKATSPGSKGDRYPTSMDLLNLCGLPLPAQYHVEENQCLKQQLSLQAEVIHKLQEKLDHLINVQIQTSQAEVIHKLQEKLDHLIDVQGQTSHQLKTLQGVIYQTPRTKPSVTSTGPEPSIDDRQSIDNLLADDEGQEMEQDVPETQQAERKDVQMLDGNRVQVSPEDEVLRIAVNSIIVDDEQQDQKQEL